MSGGAAVPCPLVVNNIMPKELTHFALARSLKSSLPRDSVFYGPVGKFPRLFLLGAVAPDIPFFYLAGPKGEIIRNISDPLHGNRALKKVVSFLDRALEPGFLSQDQPFSGSCTCHGREVAAPALALVAGVICHILSDTGFHPLVYYYAGMDGVHEGATARHRQFETAMDLHFWHQYSPPTSLARIVRNLEVPVTMVNQFLADLFEADQIPPRYFGHALTWHQVLQYLFRSGGIRHLFAQMDRLNLNLPNQITGVAYPFPGPISLGFFKEELRFRDPVTGREVVTDISILVQDTVCAGLKVLGLLSDALGRGTRASQILSEPGLPLIRPALLPGELAFWREKKDLMAVLYRGADIE